MDSNDAKRVDELRRHDILDTPAETSYSDVVYLASTMCEAPVALISLLDDHRQWFKACVGLNVSETPREIAFCNYVVQDRKPLVVEDATLDPRFAHNPLVVGAPFIRFYAGVPLLSGTFILGTLCIIDMKPRVFTNQNRLVLEALARQVMNQLELRLTLKELRRLQTELSAENGKYSNLVENLREAVFQLNADGECKYLSPAWKDILEYAPEACLGTKLLDYVSLEDRARIGEKFASLIEHKQDSSRELLKFVAKSGRIRMVEVFARRMLDRTNRTVGWTGTLSDVTQKRNDEALIESQRVKMIQSARLYALGEMAAGIAHEINNPLAIIRGTAQLLGRNIEKGTLAPEVLKESVRKIDSTVGRISKIISGLRSFAREGGDDPFVEVSVQSLIDDALELCQMRFRNNGIGLTQITRGDELMMECRPTQISQVLLNLLNNAFDAVAAVARKEIAIDVKDFDGEIQISVFDSGPGVPPELETKIMEPFFSTKGPNRGMGLGLSLSRGLIESHHGSLNYQRTHNQSCFMISIPQKQGSATDLKGLTCSLQQLKS